MPADALLRRVLATVVVALAAGSLAAQATLNVGPSGFPQIADAVAAAQPGDLIVVDSGVYNPFALPIGVRIVAPNGATITTPPGGGGLPWSHTMNPPVGQRATIVGLTWATNTVYPPAEPPVTVVVTGNVAFTNCTFRNFSDYGSNAVVCNGNADVQFDRCRFESPWDCVSVGAGRVAATDCQFLCYSVLWGAGPASGLVANGGDITLSSCLVQAAPSQAGTPAVRLSGSARLTIADSTLTAGTSQSMAGPGVLNNTVNPVRHARSIVVPTSGIISFNPFLSGPGPLFSGPDQQIMIVGGTAPTRPTEGASFSGSVIGPENSLAGVVLSFARTNATVVPFAAQPIHFDPATAVVFDVGFTGTSATWPGSGAFAWQTVVLQPPIFGVEFWLHPLVWDGSTFQVGPLAGGVVY